MKRCKPTFLSFNVSNRCNERCPMCNVWRSPADELDIPELERIFADLKRFGILLVEISGGEPFLRDDLPGIFALLDRLGLLYSVTTNGTVWRDDVVRALGRAEGIVQLAVSIDSLNPDIYAVLRGSRSLDAVLANVRRLSDARLPVPLKVNFTMSGQNWGETFAMLNFARARGMYLSVFPVNLGAGRQHSADAPALAPGDEQRARMAEVFRELAHLRRRGEPLWEYSGFYELAADYLQGKPVGPCGAGRLYLDLHADGKLAVCLEHAPVADLRREGIAAAWERVVARQGAVAACVVSSPCCYTCTTNVSLTARHRVAFLRETLAVHLKRGMRNLAAKSGFAGNGRSRPEES
ncbi:radical SAM protein [Geobacter grbiciae]|uniref:radical SAM protein n=1 Tax=Geobacter grbiciae TaxID=155042 RepID=UPI001FE8EB09|nr:radical SAM protein [Geobacter grbiciae]